MSLQNIKMQAPNTFFAIDWKSNKILLHCTVYTVVKIYANTEIIYDAADFISTVIITGCKWCPHQQQQLITYTHTHIVI